jgi:hypothetical protein
MAKTLRTCLLLVAAVVVLVAAGPARSTAVYASAAKSTFTLSSIGVVTSIVDHAPSDITSSTGAATALIDLAISSPDGVHPAMIDSKVSGTAAAPPLSMSMAAAQRGHVFVIDRTDSVGVTLTFSLAIEWATHLSVDLPGLEFAGGGAYFAISGFEDFIDSITIDPGMPGELVKDGDQWRWDYNPGIEHFGPGSTESIGATVVTGTITVLADQVGQFSVITDAAGRAGARVLPEPPMVALLTLALVAAAWQRRRG